ncbi:MFS transporter [Pseudooceanicola sp. LIPI14-2-Ac024]|uniref:MFS transporter n=1 Tax=Pseudooceanicola sp. LIPI14-2-Ac024 TaxID=3344875 RepID=UPI0035D0C2B0
MGFVRFLRNNSAWLSAGALLSFLSSFGQTFFISVFAGQIRDDFGLSLGQWGGIYTLGTGLSALVMVWAGGLTDRFRARTLASGVLIALSLACVAMSLATSVAALVVVIFLLRFTGQGMTSHIAIVAMSRWFVASRGRALSIATMGFAIGEAFLPLIFVSLLATSGWRSLWQVAAVIVLAGLVVVLLLLRRERTPQSVAESSSATGMMGRHWTRAEAMRHWLFWLMLPVISGPPAFVTTFFFHQVYYADQHGWTVIAQVALYPAYTLFGLLMVFGWGAALDRVGTGRLLPFAYLPIAVAFLLFGTATTLTGVGIGLAFMAVTVGAQATLPMAFWAEYFGTRHIGSIKAAAAAAMVMGSALGPGVSGLLIDLGVGIGTLYLWIAVWFLLSSAAMWAGMRRARPLLTAAG